MKPPRPDEDDVRIEDKILERLLPSVRVWIEENSFRFDAEPSEDQVEADLRHAISSGGNGYQIARRLDGLSGWDEIDAGLVAILDKTSDLRTGITKAFVREWVTAHDVKPRYQVGQAVSHLGTSGVIAGVMADLGLYKFIADEDKGRGRFYARDVPFEQIDDYENGVSDKYRLFGAVRGSETFSK